MDNAQILSWIVGAIGITGFLLAGRKVWWAWYVNLICQLFWFAYAIVSDTPAFFVTALFYTAVFGYNAWQWTRERKKPVAEESNTVQNARRELKLIGEDPDVIEWYCRVIKEYHSFGHSGGSHMAVMPTLTKLLNQEPLTSLTNNPEEWMHHTSEVWGEPGGIWQNVRDGRMFSTDGGLTFTNVEDRVNSEGGRTIYASVPTHAHV